jgi:hypothetical protein
MQDRVWTNLSGRVDWALKLSIFCRRVSRVSGELFSTPPYTQGLENSMLESSVSDPDRCWASRISIRNPGLDPSINKQKISKNLDFNCSVTS